MPITASFKAVLCCLALAGLTLAAGCDSPEYPEVVHSHDRDLVSVDVQALDAVVQSATSQGKVAVVEVWATWCAPCIDLIPLMKKAAHDRGDKMQLISLSVDGPEDAGQAKTTLKQLEKDISKEFGIHAHLLDNAYILPNPEHQQALLGDSIAPPTVFIYGTDGKLFKRIDGSDANSLIGEITQAIDDAIAAAG
ncbi:MAG: TlpA disulfide reductase family protein [Planctomycetota bacterium]